MSLWTREAERDDVNLRVGQVLKQKLDIPDQDQLRWVFGFLRLLRFGVLCFVNRENRHVSRVACRQASSSLSIAVAGGCGRDFY